MIGLLDEAGVRALIARLWQRNPPLALRGAAECVFDLHDVLQGLLSQMPPGEAATTTRRATNAPAMPTRRRPATPEPSP